MSDAMSKTSNRPILRGHTYALRGKATPSGPNLGIAVHCPYCDQLHHHGWDAGVWRPEHRVAHCASDSGSPFNDGGYWIAPYRKRDMPEMKQ